MGAERACPSARRSAAAASRPTATSRIEWPESSASNQQPGSWISIQASFRGVQRAAFGAVTAGRNDTHRPAAQSLCTRGQGRSVPRRSPQPRLPLLRFAASPFHHRSRFRLRFVLPGFRFQWVAPWGSSSFPRAPVCQGDSGREARCALSERHVAHVAHAVGLDRSGGGRPLLPLDPQRPLARPRRVEPVVPRILR